MQIDKMTVSHQVVASKRPFADVLSKLESQMGRVNAEQLWQIGESSTSGEQFVQAVEPFVGPSGFTIFFETDHGLWISRLFEPFRAKLYVLGNPLLAKDIVLQDSRVGLYVPTRLYVDKDKQGITHLAFDRLSDLLSQFHNPAISAVAEIVDQKLESLIVLVSQ